MCMVGCSSSKLRLTMDGFEIKERTKKGVLLLNRKNNSFAASIFNRQRAFNYDIRRKNIKCFAHER